MLSFKFSSLTCVALLAFAATSTITQAAEKDGLVATVNGTKITASMLQDYQHSRGIADNDLKKQQIQMMVEEMINRELIFQDALKNGVDKTPAVKKQMESLHKNVVAGAMLKNVAQSGNITDDDLKKEYEQRKHEMVTQEYKASHILVEKEDTAKEIIKELTKGAKFADLVKSKSIGPGAEHGGDIGWFKPGEMDKEFSDAVVALKDGEYTKTPVKTQFGWHVILREASREIPPPSFDQMKEQLKMHVQNLQIQDYIAALRKKAKIERPK
jgi:peptidyl-prolyl cis-trans isomerase C